MPVKIKLCIVIES